MTKRAVLTIPMADLQKPRPMTMEKGITMEGSQRPTPGPSLTGSDSLSPLSSCSAMPPSTKGDKEASRNAGTCDPRRLAAVAGQEQAAPDPSGADGLINNQWPVPRWPSPQYTILGQGTPLWLAVPLAVPGSNQAPLPEKTIKVEPLVDPSGTAMPLAERAIIPTPLLSPAAPLADEGAQMAHPKCSVQLAMPPSEIADAVSTLLEEPDRQGVKVEPSRPDSYWIQEEGASGPLATEASSPTSSVSDSASPIKTLLENANAAGSAPLAIPEDSEILPVESPEKLDCLEHGPVGTIQSHVKPQADRPSVAEILQQWLVCEQVRVTTTEMEETILQQSLEIGAEPMVISGGNTPVAPDDEELDAEEEQALMMDKSCL